MTYTEIKELLDAGFTRDDIMSFVNPQNSQGYTQDEKPNINLENVPNNSEKTEDNPGAQAIGAPDPLPGVEENTNNSENPAFTELNHNIEKLIRTIQVSNLVNNSMDKNPTVDINKQVDSIMESIIRPIKEVKK